MAQASRAGGLPPLAPTLRGAGEEPGRRGPAGAEAWSGRRLPVAGSVPRAEPGPARWAAAAVAGAGAREPSAGTPMPPALRRLRAVLLRLQREREQLLYARDCARQLQAAVRLVLQSPSPGAPPSAPARDPLALPPRGPGPAPLLLARPVGLAARHLEAALETQLRALGREPAGPRLSSRLADALGALPAFQQLQGRAAGRVPGAARPFPPARVLRLLTAERGCQLAIRLDRALWTSGLRDQLRKACQEERELLPGVLGLLGGVAGSAPRGPGLGGAGALWSQYWALLWAACAQSLSINLGPWRDPRAATQQLDPEPGQAPLPAECEKELVSLGRSLWRQSLIWNWDQGFCRALGCSRDDRALPSSSHTSGLWQQLFPPLLDALREDTTGLHLSAPPAPAPLALGLCTLQATLLWFGGRAQQHLAAWAPTSFLLLTQKDLPPLLQEAEGLHRLVSEESWAPELGWQLGQLAAQVQRLATHIQLLPEEYLSLFFQECQRQAAQGFEMYMPRGRYWRHRLLPELPSIPSEYAGLVVRTVLEPVLQGLQELPTQAQASALGQALTAILGAWLDHILTHEIRFSLQGALQLRRDFGVVRELLEEERWGVSPELRQTLLMLGIFQRLDGALLCLLQQPLPKARVRRRPSCCCACNEVQTMELPSSNLNSLENLEPPPRPGVTSTQTAQLLGTLRCGGQSPEVYLVGNQEAWLALRQNQRPRWHLPFLFCLGLSPET
ncbi:coiled-coil domain-containing protein 142 isoform X3 [Sorex araneus]|uniref:coiled-coil domain-containing protein 142 isoform X3 n=1 Tax=Sorex araneus TaxID=42254 RepID=UPI00243342C2|nr:coiled-coil domain-containing protein 142 isoform X3 [Sorex araneus]